MPTDSERTAASPVEISVDGDVTTIRIPTGSIPPAEILERGGLTLIAVGADEIASSGGGNTTFFDERFYIFQLAQSVAAIQSFRKARHA